MTLDIYRSINGLGTRASGAKVVSYAPWIEYDDTQCLRVDEIAHQPALLLRVDTRPVTGNVGLYVITTSEITLTTIDEIALIGVDAGYPMNGAYALGCDIDASNTETWDGGAGWLPIGTADVPFTGTFDGKGYTISGLFVDRPATHYIGLFGHATGTIKNLRMKSANITGNDLVGGIVGYSTGTVTNCIGQGTVTGRYRVAAVCAKSTGTISYCVGQGTVTAYVYASLICGHTLGTITNCVAIGSATGTASTASGICAYVDTGATVTKCYTSASAYSPAYSGGVTAQNLGTVSYCYSIGGVSGTVAVGGAVGINTGTVTGVYYDTQTSGQSDTGKGEGKTTAQMKTQSTYAAWDFVATWEMIAGEYPSFLSPLVTDTQYKITSGNHYAKVTSIATVTAGVMDIRPVLVHNNDVGMSDQSDPSGVVTYRALFLYNNTGATATINTIACASGWKVYLAGSAAETTVTVADEETAPTGPTFAASISPALSLAAGAFVPMWLERTVSADAGEHVGTVTITYNTTSTVVLSGAYVTKDTSIPPYYLYYVIDATGTGATTIDNADNVASPDPIASLPHTVDVGAIQDDMHGLGTDNFILRGGVRAVTTAGAQSQNQLLDYALHLDWTSGDVTVPNAPTIDTVEYLDGGQVRVVVDHDQSGATVRAKKLTATIGAESITKLLSGTEDDTETEFIFQTPVAWGSSVTVSVVAVDASGRTSAADTDTGTAYYEYGDSTGYGTIPAAMTGASPDFAEFTAIESFGDVDVIAAAGMTSISCNGVSVFTAQTAPHASTRLHTLALTGGTITAGACTDPIEPVSTTAFYLCAGGSRVAAVDLTAGTLTCPVFNDTTVLDCPLEGPYQEIGNYVYWQYFDLSTNRWKPFMIVDLAGTAIHFIKNLECI